MTGAQDLLERAASDASARAGEALASIVGKPLKPAMKVLGVTKDTGQGGAIGVKFDVDGVEDCSMLMTFPPESLAVMREMLAPGVGPDMVPDEQVAFEVANICTSHFLNSLGDSIQRILKPSPPARAPPAALPAPSATDVVILTEFEADNGAHFGGAILFHGGKPLMAEMEKRASG